MTDAIARVRRPRCLVDDPFTAGWHQHGVRGAFEFGLGHWLSAVDFCDQANAMFREQCTGVWWHQYMAASLSLWGLLNRGRLIELFQRIALWSAEAAARGIPYLETILKMRLGSMKRLAADDPEGARRQAEEALMGWSSTDFYLQHTFKNDSCNAMWIYIARSRGSHCWIR